MPKKEWRYKDEEWRLYADGLWGKHDFILARLKGGKSLRWYCSMLYIDMGTYEEAPKFSLPSLDKLNAQSLDEAKGETEALVYAYLEGVRNDTEDIMELFEE